MPGPQQSITDRLGPRVVRRQSFPPRMRCGGGRIRDGLDLGGAHSNGNLVCKLNARVRAGSVGIRPSLQLGHRVLP